MGKTLRILFSLLLLLPIAAMRDVVKEWSIHYDLDNFDITQEGDVVSVLPDPFCDLPHYVDYDMPAIPLLVYHVCDVGKKNESLNVEIEWSASEKTLIATDVDIATMMATSPKGGLLRDLYIPYTRFDGYFPEKKVDYQVIWGRVALRIYPFEYDETTRSLYFTPDISVTLKFKEFYDIRWVTSEGGDVLNKVDILSATISGGTVPNSLNPDFDVEDDDFEDGVDYLIITSTVYDKKILDAFAPLIEWKRQKGLRSKLITVDDIYNTATAPTQEEAIKSYIDSL